MEKKAALPGGRSATGAGRPGAASPAEPARQTCALRREAIEAGVEAICSKGCRVVRQDLAALERGEIPPELEQMGPGERRQVHRQLRAIMAVYGDVCRTS